MAGQVEEVASAGDASAEGASVADRAGEPVAEEGVRVARSERGDEAGFGPRQVEICAHVVGVISLCAASAVAVARVDGSDLRAHIGEVDDAGDEGDDVEEDHAHAHGR